MYSFPLNNRAAFGLPPSLFASPIDAILGVWIEWVGVTVQRQGGTPEQVIDSARTRGPELVDFFATRGIDRALVTPELLEALRCQALGIVTPVRNFAAMIEAIKQHHNGLVTFGELILALQCTAHQITALDLINRLPPCLNSETIAAKWDSHIETQVELKLPAA